ncbi:hypothetical protein SEA_OTTAWA_98 [Arthrobacter phage Ottawa]|nr:hypothetical protein SEA_KHARCHO_98 [Arthrobacter phage Kharcho]WIC89330.1 hypothetical protein SEA_OTTAWA_98 [Arthrobacter phage Ottawa]
MSETRKMVNLKIHETSGVDHPAHQHEGWIVMKSASAESVESLFGSLNKAEEAPVADNEKTPEELLAEKDARIAELEAQVAAPPAAEPAPAAEVEPAPAAEDAEAESLEKALNKMPEPLRKAFAKQQADLAEAQATINKERDARLDGDAIAKSREVFKAIAIDHDTVAPALRRVALLDADLAKAVETALSAADAQLATGTVFKEVGNPGNGEGSATERINKAASAIREADPSLSTSQAFVKAISDNPELYAAYTAEKAGK